MRERKNEVIVRKFSLISARRCVCEKLRASHSWQSSVVEHALRRTVCSVFHYSCRLLLVVFIIIYSNSHNPQNILLCPAYSRNIVNALLRSRSFIKYTVSVYFTLHALFNAVSFVYRLTYSIIATPSATHSTPKINFPFSIFFFFFKSFVFFS